MLATGIVNYEVKDGIIFPEYTLILTDKNKTEHLNIPDLFADLKEGKSKDQFIMLTAKLTTGVPRKAGETYHLHLKFTINKNSSHIIAETELVMKNLLTGFILVLPS